jgi:menaquinone-dependent protoporphyrinogen oxidase
MKSRGDDLLNRRGFMVRAGTGAAGLAGATILGAAGTLALPAIARAAAGDPVVEFIRTNCGEETARPRILVGYASLCGSTGGIAEAIGKKLCAAGARVDVKHLPDVTDLAGYQAFVLGSPIQAGMWMSEATKFIMANREELAKAPVAYFIACMALSVDNAESRKMAQGYVERPLKLAPKIKPVALGAFAGAVDYAKMPKRYYAVMRSIHPKDQDARDWEKIGEWGEELAGQMVKK